MLYRVEDWDDAYANGPNIPQGERWPQAWVEPARAFRDAMAARGRFTPDIAYGDHARERLDLFLPEGEARGLVVFIHGGFWVRLDKSYWSDLAAGPVSRGWAVAMPSYTLAPEARVAEIGRQMARAVETAAGHVSGPIRLTGHSAGGHLATRLVVDDGLLERRVAARVERVVSLSGLHDLRPLLRTKLNDDVRLDAEEAAAESPALLAPRTDVDVIAWVGGAEREEFLRQSALLPNIWRGLGARTESVVEPDRHHFDVIDGLKRADSALTEALLG
ncbi:MAG: alpha/beta hydrolase [Pseudomonadota bacterium]